MTENTQVALVHIPSDQAVAVFLKEGGLDPYIEIVKKEARSFVADPNTKAGKQLINQVARKVTQSRDYLDGVGKGIVDDLKKQPKLIDAERKRMRDILNALVEEIKSPVIKLNEQEEQRIQNINNRIHAMKTMYVNGTLQMYQESLLRLVAIDIDDSFAEFKSLAEEVKRTMINQHNDEIKRLTQQELERRELERLREESVNKRIEQARQEGAQSIVSQMGAVTGQNMPYVPDHQVDHTPSLNTPQKLIGRVENPVNDVQLSDFSNSNSAPPELQITKEQAQSEAYQSIIALGCPADQASWFLSCVLNGHIKHVKFVF